MSTDERPVNRCATRACPMVGHWEPGAHCPMHRSDPPRQPTLEEQWAAEADDGVVPPVSRDW